MISQIEVEEKMNDGKKLQKIERHYRYAVTCKVMDFLVLGYFNKHGYTFGQQIMRYCKRDFDIHYSSGTVYTVIYKLAGQGFIEIIKEDDARYDCRRKKWEITSEGLERLTLLEKSPLLSKLIDALRAKL